MLKAKKLFGYRRKILESKQVNTHQAETLLICLVVHGSPSTKKKDASQKCCVRTNFAINEHVSCHALSSIIETCHTIYILHFPCLGITTKTQHTVVSDIFNAKMRLYKQHIRAYLIK